MGHLLFAIFLLTFSIFIHELGHFLAARARGLAVPRFSIFGIGNPIWAWKWRGVEYCICWLPIGAYVMIPQLANLGEFEGEVPEETAKLPPAGYLSVVIVALAGPVANILLALALACVVWSVGIQVPAEFNRTEIGEVAREITSADGKKIPGPAAAAGLQAGDIITAIDGKPVKDFAELMNAIILSGNLTDDGRRLASVTFTRNGIANTVPVYPELAGTHGKRNIGVFPRFEVIIGDVQPGQPAEQAGLKAGDRILTFNGKALKSRAELSTLLKANQSASVRLGLRRADEHFDVTITPFLDAKIGLYRLGIQWPMVTIHKTPIEQFGDVFRNIGQTFSALSNRNTDVGLSDMSSVIGIVATLKTESEAGLPDAFALLLMINLSLAVFNLLPIPVLDGGHIAMATYAKLRGKPLPSAWIQNSVKVCFLLLISLIIYVSYFDIRRVVLSHTREAPAATPASAPASTKP